MFGEISKLKIEKEIEEKVVVEPYRKYFGISQIGNPCTRYLFYQFRFYLQNVITPREKRLYQRGHREESIIITDLEEAGVRVISTQNEMTACSGHIKGHLDATLENIPDAPTTPHLGEFKTSATKYFNQLVSSQSVKKTFVTHYDQCQGYMHLQKLTRALYICVNKEDDRRYYEIIDYDKQYAISLFEKAEIIIMATMPPNKIGDSSFYRCGPKWCQFRNICHFKETETINKTCRSCKFIEVHDKGRWYCSKKQEFRTFKQQKKGCKKYLLLK